MNQSEFIKSLKKTGLFVADIAYNAFIIIVLVVLIRSFLISPFRVIGSSMADTLQNQEFILIDKISYILGDVDRGDPIVFLPPPTSKDSPKFEETVKTDSAGMGTLDLSNLIKNKDTLYCRGGLKALWFCKEKVLKNDLVYIAPEESRAGSLSRETNWSLAERSTINEDTVKEEIFAFQGGAEATYTVRVYDSRGPEYFVKRVIGVPGDTVKIDNGRVYVKTKEDEDFHKINESFLNAENKDRTYINQKLRQNVYVVPEGHYFVMGDNRNHSNDSRSWLEPITQDAFPFVPKANISGKVMVILWPPQNIQLVKAADF